MIEQSRPALVASPRSRKRGRPVAELGCSSYGYDLRLSANEFLIFRMCRATVMNPKRFNPANLEPARLPPRTNGRRPSILPAHSYGLGVALERLRCRPQHRDLLGNEPYARLGIMSHHAAKRAGGAPTLEFSNSFPVRNLPHSMPTRACCQLLFFEGDPCDTTVQRSARANNQTSRAGDPPRIV